MRSFMSKPFTFLAKKSSSKNALTSLNVSIPRLFPAGFLLCLHYYIGVAWGLRNMYCQTFYEPIVLYGHYLFMLETILQALSIYYQLAKNWSRGAYGVEYLPQTLETALKYCSCCRWYRHGNRHLQSGFKWRFCGLGTGISRDPGNLEIQQNVAWNARNIEPLPRLTYLAHEYK